MSLIEFNQVCKQYPGASSLAVDHLDLKVEAGEFLTLLGPSGSGKTTTLMMLAGFESTSSGTIRLNGQPIEQLPAHQRNMGVVFQSYSLFPHMTVAQNVAFPLRVRKLPVADVDRRVAAALARVHLQDYGARKPNQLSGGQQQRVALARALVFEPSLVLMDEPLAALDKKLREEMQLEIRRLHRELGVTMVFVTHDQGEAMTLSDRVAVFNHGRIEQLGSPQALYDEPANPFVAGFLGDNNRLVCTIDGADAGTRHVRVNAQMGATSLALTARAGSAMQQSSGQGTLCLRPERLQILAEPTGGTMNQIPATVQDLIHQGDHWRVLVQAGGLDPSDGAVQWFAKLSPNALPQGLRSGQRIILGFHPDDAWVF